MNRKDIINFCNEKIFPQVRGEAMFHMNCKNVIKLVTNWRRENNWPKTMIPEVKNGYLSINNIPAGRMTIMDKKPSFDELSYYIEGKILARQEEE